MWEVQSWLVCRRKTCIEAASASGSDTGPVGAAWHAANAASAATRSDVRNGNGPGMLNLGAHPSGSHVSKASFVRLGHRDEHVWNDDHTLPNAERIAPGIEVVA